MPSRSRSWRPCFSLPWLWQRAFSSPTSPEAGEAGRQTGQGLVVPPFGALDALHKQIPNRYQPLVSGAGLTGRSSGLALREIAYLQDLVRDQIVRLRVLGRMGLEPQGRDSSGQK